MSLKERVTGEMKAAMKSGDKIRLETLRSIRALILEFEKSGVDREIGADDELKMINSAVKKRKEAIEQFHKAGRTELEEKETSELNILMEFMPKQLSADEIQTEVKKLAAELNATAKEHFPLLMPAAMKLLKGKADGGMVRSEVEKALGLR
jgi:uncharacterized protein YqeY